jgi:hypothetical protein
MAEETDLIDPLLMKNEKAKAEFMENPYMAYQKAQKAKKR